MTEQGSEQPRNAGFSRGGLLVVLLALILLAIGFGPLLLRERRNQRILREGVPAAARVRDIKPTGNYHNEQPEVRISLDVTAEGDEPFQADLTTYLSPVYLPRFQPGALVQVRYDQKDRRQVALVEP